MFYSALKASGRAGFVMGNSTCEARSSEQEIRANLIKSKAVDVMIAVGPNMFYTVTLPCTLWFFDKGKLGSDRENKVLFIDARHIYRQIDRAHRDWTQSQISFITNIIRLYRNQKLDFSESCKEALEKTNELFGRQPKYADILGLCKVASIEEIELQDWSLNPGRYVGVAPGEEISNSDFIEQIITLNDELTLLNSDALRLEKKISKNISEIIAGLI